MAANKLQWRRIAKGDKLPCQSFLRKKNGEILKLSTGAGVTVGQDAYYLPIDDVINVIKDYPVEESEDGKIRKALVEMVLDTIGDSPWVDYNVHKEDAIAWLEEQGEHANFRNKIQIGDKVTRNEDGVLVNLSQLNRVAKKDEKQGEQKSNPCENCSIATNNCQNFPCTIRDGEQKPAEWSEEDERIKNNLLSELTNLSVRKLIKKETEKKYASWLKSLKDRVQPQPQWKPSDEQLYILEKATHIVGSKYKSCLASLYQELKKLKD